MQHLNTSFSLLGRVALPCLLLVCSLSLSAQKKVSPDLLDLNNGVYYQRNHMEPFSGTAYEEYPNGQKKMSIPIKKGKIEGVAREWAPNGQVILEVAYVDGLKEGLETQWFPQGGKRLEINNSGDKPNGMCYEWHRTGNLRSEGEYRAGKETGEHKWYYDDGALDQIVPYTDGLPEGNVRTFYQNGELKSEASFSRGQMNGLKKEYYSDGSLRSSFSYQNDKENGEGKIWSKSGQLLERYEFEEGKEILHEDFHSGSVRSALGYYQVFNEPKGHCYLHVTGQEVLPRGRDEILYIIDGMILQIITTTIESLKDLPEDASPTAIFENYITRETDYIGRSIGTEIEVQDSSLVSKTDVPGVHWHFQSPLQPGEETTPRTIIEEHYLTFLCGNRLISLYAPVTRSDEPSAVLDMLNRVGDSVTASADPINLNGLVTE